MVTMGKNRSKQNGPSGGAATGAVFFIECTVGDVAPGDNQATSAIIVPSFKGSHPALSLCFTYELVQIDLEISGRIRIDHKTEDTIVR